MKSSFAHLTFIFIVLLALAGCASVPPAGSEMDQTIAEAKQSRHPSSDEVGIDQAAPEGWWQIGFRIYWSGAKTINGEDENGDAAADAEDEDPSWYVGTMLADQVLAPILKSYGDDIFMWRVHRRASDDETGHQFSFIFYANQQVADEVIKIIGETPLVAEMIEAGVLNDVVYPDTSTITKPAISDTADQNWPEEIQRTWPMFIMGVSQTWLMMVESIADAQPQADQKLSLNDKLEFYQTVHEELDELWREQGRHAYLHHISSVFAYGKVLMRF